jgi:hypothetical protein
MILLDLIPLDKVMKIPTSFCPAIMPGGEEGERQKGRGAEVKQTSLGVPLNITV